MLAREVSGRAYPEMGVSDSHHPLSHHQDEAAKLERLHKINEYHFRQFAHFAHLVTRMAGTPEGDGTMLDHTVFLYGTGISDSNTHFHNDLPIAVVGGQKAGIRGVATFGIRSGRRLPTCFWRSWTNSASTSISSETARAGSILSPGPDARRSPHVERCPREHPGGGKRRFFASSNEEGSRGDATHNWKPL
jgi:hypothetical protein